MSVFEDIDQDKQTMETNIKAVLADIERVGVPDNDGKQVYLKLRKSDLDYLLYRAYSKAHIIEQSLADKKFDPNDETQMSEVKKHYSIAYGYMRLVAKYHWNLQDRYKALLRCVYLASYAHLYEVVVADANELLKSPHFTESDAYQLRNNVHFQLALINTKQ